MAIAYTSFPFFQIILKITVTTAYFCQFVYDPFCKQGSSEIGMYNNTRGVNNIPQA